MKEDSLERALQEVILPFYHNDLESGSFAGQGDLPISYVKLTVPEEKGALVISPGRTESHIKYAELIYDLREAGLSIYALDHRGQGFSGRMLDDPQKGYVERFDDYVADLKTFINTIVNAETHRKRFILAHSLGGTIAALYAAGHSEDIDGLILSAPMFKINIAQMPRPAAYILASGLTWLGRGGEYVPGGAGYDPDSLFEENEVTHSEVRYAVNKALITRHPEIALGSTTNRWVWESLKATHRARSAAPEIEIPVLLFQAGQDTVVRPEGLDTFCRRARNCRRIRLDGSRHEILMEKDHVRDKAIALILDYLNSNT